MGWNIEVWRERNVQACVTAMLAVTQHHTIYITAFVFQLPTLAQWLASGAWHNVTTLKNAMQWSMGIPQCFKVC